MPPSASTVSTHSRPKAAGHLINQQRKSHYCFNTQPPEGGWVSIKPETCRDWAVSTHSRPKAAGCRLNHHPGIRRCFNTQPPEGGWKTDLLQQNHLSCFNTQPPEGGWGQLFKQCQRVGIQRFNTQPPEGGWVMRPTEGRPMNMFQHTAARRRLGCGMVRSKRRGRFNTQPPEGGWT